ncbi:MAG: adenylate/guanylate cyclase domain-containing protein [Casimicrobiaceae bacterium]
MADVVGYSRHMERDEAGAFARLQGIRGRVIDPKIAEHGGRVVKTAGDGMLLEFGSADAALRCAIDVQRAMSADNQSKAPDERTEFRIGINLGDIIVDGNDIAGDGVNVAARLEALAEPGGICVSADLRPSTGAGGPIHA